MAVILTLCKIFPGSRWAIVRKDLPTLRRNVLPVFEKLRQFTAFGSVNQSTWEATHPNGSRIIFFPESYDTDKEYERWKGLEVNGFWLEEANELKETSWTWSLQRAGAYIIPATLQNPHPIQPPPYILLTSNPATNWVKRVFYTPWKNGTLKAPFFYLPATVKDNPHLPKEYLEQLELLPERDYKVYVLGLWEELAGQALEELNERIHIVPRPKIIPDHWTRFGAFDWGYSHPFSFGLYLAAPERIYKVETITGRKMNDANMIRYITEVAETVDFPVQTLEYTVAGPDAWNETEAKANIAETTAERFAKANIPMIKATTARITGLKNFREMTAWQKTGPVIEGVATPGEPRFQWFDTKANHSCFEQCQNMILDPDRPEDVLKVDANDEGEGGDDSYDETRYGLQSRAEAHKPAVSDVVPEDHHPGFDYRKKERRPRRPVITDPLAQDEDDMRPNLYRVPRGYAATAYRMPRPNQYDQDEDDGDL